MLIHTIAAVLLDIFYLLTGLTLCFIGQKLLVKGVEGRTKIEGEITGGKWSLNTTSPGIVFAICGLAIIIYAIITPSEYENKITEATVKSNNEQINSDLTAGITERNTRTTSRLFDQSSKDAALKSLVTIYAIQHKYQKLENNDVRIQIGEMPKKENQEPFTRTNQRFKEILKENPVALMNMLDQNEYKWILEKDKVDHTLSRMVEEETRNLTSAQNNNNDP